MNKAKTAAKSFDLSHIEPSLQGLAVPIGDVYEDPSNIRRHPQRSLDAICNSLRRFRQQKPIVIAADGRVLAGNGTVQAARKLGWNHIAAQKSESLSGSHVEATAFALADNRSQEHSFFDEQGLADLLDSLRQDGVPLEEIGWSDEEFDDLLNSLSGGKLDGLTDEDAAPEPPEVPVTQTGDVWLLGDHRLLCGDATNLEAVQKVLAGGLADMVFTDPPYNVNYGATMKDKLRGKKRKIANDNLGDGFEQFLRDVCANLLTVTKGAIYVCMSSSELHTLHRAFTESGGHWSTFVIWAKNTFTMGRSDYQRQYEPILYGWKEGTDHFWCGARDQGDVWLVKKPVANDLHPTMKPVELIERALTNSSRRGGVVVDLFGGSGSTLIACERMSRVGFLMEIDPRYCDVILRRWEQFTGREARLEDGRSFAQIAGERLDEPVPAT